MPNLGKRSGRGRRPFHRLAVVVTRPRNRADFCFGL